MKNSTICCDASVVIPLFDPQRAEHVAIAALWEHWASEQMEIIAPMLLRYEVTNAIYRSVRYKKISSELGARILQSLAVMPIRYADTFEMHTEAYEFAQRFNMKTSYDGHYIALARREGVSLFTADKKLANIAKPHYSFVRYVDEEKGSTI